MQKSNHTTGKTKDGSFQIGVRKTFDIDHKRAWQIMTSEAGIRLWLGESAGTPIEVDQPFTLIDGTDVNFSVIKPDSHLRLKWQPPQWAKASTIQIRTIQNGKKTVVAFHQENMPDEQARNERRAFFKAVLDQLAAVFKNN